MTHYQRLCVYFYNSESKRNHEKTEVNANPFYLCFILFFTAWTKLPQLYDEALTHSGIIDPLAELDIDIQSFDIPRAVTVYPDRAGVRWWTKAWFNNREEGEASVEIEREQAIRFIHDNIEKDVWLEEFYPKQMEIYHNAIEQTKEQLLMNRIG